MSENDLKTNIIFLLCQGKNIKEKIISMFILGTYIKVKLEKTLQSCNWTYR
jgi:hypothetical protein